MVAAMRRLSMRKIREVLRLHFECGCQHRQIALACDMSPSTVSGYLSRAEHAELTWEQAKPLSDAEVEARLFSYVGRSKFARLANGDFVELERDLRDTLELLSAASVDLGKRQQGVVLSRSAFATLEQLSANGSGFTLESDVASYRAQLEAAFSKTPKLPRGLEAELRDYQLEGFRWLARLADAELSACLADDMGLGKTLQAIALLLYRAKQGSRAPNSCRQWASPRRSSTRLS
jgi:DNA-binding transcriptional ArsR family regulator